MQIMLHRINGRILDNPAASTEDEEEHRNDGGNAVSALGTVEINLTALCHT